MFRTIAFSLLVLVPVLASATRPTAWNHDSAGKAAVAGPVANLRQPISPAGLGDCTFDVATHLMILSDRVVDRDENDNEDDFREASDLPRSYEPIRDLISRTVPDSTITVSPLAAATRRSPLLC